jgi:hypothetical protein
MESNIEKKFEIVYRDIEHKYSKITLTPTRCTLKISVDDAKNEQRFISFAKWIVKNKKVTKSFRGLIKLFEDQLMVNLQSDSKLEHFTVKEEELWS